MTSIRRWWLSENRLRAYGLVIGVGVVVARWMERPHPGTTASRLLLLILLTVAAVACVVVTVARNDSLTMLLGTTSLMASGAVLALSLHPGATIGLLLIGSFAAGQSLPGRWVAVGFAITIALGVLSAALHGTSHAVVGGDFGGAFAMMMVGNARRVAIARIDQAELMLAQAQRAHEEHLVANALAERTRIARDLHDVLAHSLSAIAIHVEVAREMARREDPESGLLEPLHDARDAVLAGLAESRQVVATLRGDTLALPTLLQGLVAEHQGAGESVDVEVDFGETVLAPATTTALYRIVQEALSNARKHSIGHDARLTLRMDTGEVVMSVRNPANQLNARGRSEGYGLIGIRERIAELGGTFSAGLDEGAGEWVLRAVLPLVDRTDSRRNAPAA